MQREMQPVRDVLRRLRSKLRRSAAVRALALVVATMALVALVSFALDWFLDLPLAVRAIHLAAFVIGVLVLARWATAPLRAPMDDARLAQTLEDAVPDLGDRLASALDFETRLDDPDEPESREMMRIVVMQAGAYAQKIRPETLVDTRASRRALLVAGGAVSALALAALLAPSAFGLWVKRGIFLQDVAWPRRTNVRVVDFTVDDPRIVTRGDDLRIVAEVDGQRPRELQLHFEALEFDADGGDPRITETDSRRMFPLVTEEGDTGQYAFDFRSVATSFRFWVTGGDDDDRDPVYEVRAMVPPRIASTVAQVTSPDYSGRPVAVVRESSFDVLEGSRVELTLRANMPLASAQLVPREAAAQELVVEGDGRDSLRVELVVREDQIFHIELIADSGQRNRAEEDRFRIRAVEDEPPEVRVLFPLARLYRTPQGLVPVKAIVRDDFSIATANLDVLEDGQPLRSTLLWPEGESPAPRKRLDVYAPVEIGSLSGGDQQPIVAGDVIELSVRALDNDQNETVAPAVTIEVLSREDLERRLTQRQVGLRDLLMQLRAHQRRTTEGIRKLRQAVASAPPSLDDIDAGRDLQVEQGRVTNELDQFLRGVHGVFDAYVLNRLGSIPTVDRLLPLYHETLAAPSEDVDGVFPRKLYRTIVEQKRAKRLYDPEILGALLDIMDLGDEAVVELSPAVYDALRAWSGADGPRAELLEEAERRADELEQKLAELERRMDRWETLSEIVELARQIRNRQIGIGKPLPKKPDDENDRDR